MRFPQHCGFPGLFCPKWWTYCYLFRKSGGKRVQDGQHRKPDLLTAIINLRDRAMQQELKAGMDDSFSNRWSPLGASSPPVNPNMMERIWITTVLKEQWPRKLLSWTCSLRTCYKEPVQEEPARKDQRTVIDQQYPIPPPSPLEHGCNCTQCAIDWLKENKNPLILEQILIQKKKNLCGFSFIFFTSLQICTLPVACKLRAISRAPWASRVNNYYQAIVVCSAESLSWFTVSLD